MFLNESHWSESAMILICLCRISVSVNNTLVKYELYVIHSLSIIYGHRNRIAASERAEHPSADVPTGACLLLAYFGATVWDVGDKSGRGFELHMTWSWIESQCDAIYPLHENSILTQCSRARLLSGYYRNQAWQTKKMAIPTLKTEHKTCCIKIQSKPEVI